MRGLLFLIFLFFTSLPANEGSDYVNNDANQGSLDASTQKVLYISYAEVPKRVLKGEIFSLTIKTLSTIKNFTDIEYKLSGHKGLEILNPVPYREEKSKYYYDTFYFLATRSEAKLPDFTAYLVNDQEIDYKETTLLGTELNVITLNPKKDFSKIIANSFKLIEYKTTHYDNKHNIVIFVAEAENCDIKSLKLNNVYKQGIESLTDSIFNSKITYYAVINKEIENFSFSYFNLKTNSFSLINIPIIVDDDSVSTQSDLKPIDQSKERLKMSIAAIIAIIAFVFVLWRKKYLYLIFILFPLAYIIHLSIPSKDVCIKQGSKIYLLPVQNGTIFETAQTQLSLKKEGDTKGFIKVKLKNDKIGWIRNEDLCSH
ncbi:hypothetical protein KKG72_02775 [bacterium]|nr:hypothetical protein [bacterium]MBU1994243.1 hypothetical protein [bacterium]